MPMRQRLAVLLVLSCLVSPGLAREIHVAPAGDDKNPGTVQQPLRTLAAAAQKVEPGDVCVIHAGVYRQTLRPERSGTAEKPIVFKAAGDGDVILSGTEPIARFDRHDGDIYKAKLPADLGPMNQIFFDGRMLTEARWPNEADGDPMTANGAPVQGGDSESIICKELPADLTTDKLQGATVWALVGSAWSSWTSPIVRHDVANHRLYFETYAGHWWIDEPHNPRKKKGIFHIRGAMALLDAPGEWHVDRAAGVVYLIPPGKANPADHRVEAKARQWAIDLSDRKWITIDGVQVFGASIDLRDAEHCTVQSVRATYISHTRGGRTVNRLDEVTGVQLAGRHNTLRDSEISLSAGHGVELGGSDNRLINCWIHHVDYMGVYCSPVDLGGLRQLVSHCTIHDGGRDTVKLGGAEHLIQYNDIFRPGRICHDLGVIYSAGLDGGNTEIRYNHVHDNPGPAGYFVGIYLDNYMKNFLVHHNLVWNVSNSIRLNRPTGFCMITHNTVTGNINNAWGPWKGQRTQWGSHVMNNLTAGGVTMNSEVPTKGNVQAPAGEFVDVAKRGPVTPRPGIDAAVLVPGINDSYEGSGPDVGAFEAGRPAWRAGHDFSQRPDPRYEPPTTPLRNHVRNSAFDYPGDDPLVGWRRSGAGKVKIEHHPGFNSPPAESRHAIIRASARLSGESPDGIEQTITTLEPNTKYFFSGYTRHEEGTNVRFAVKLGAGEAAGDSAEVKLEKHQRWRHVVVPFATGPGETSVTITIMNRGPGDAHIDDTGVVPARWME